MGCYNSEQLPGILIASLTASWCLTINILSILVLNIIISIIILVMVIIIMIITNMMIMTELREGRCSPGWRQGDQWKSGGGTCNKYRVFFNLN